MPGGSGRDEPSCGSVVLVVEDESLIAMHLEMMLVMHGWCVLGPAMSVKEALRLLDGSDQPPDLAVLDVNLKGQMAAPVAAALQALGVPFVLASAYDRREAAGAEALAGVPNVGKPIDERRLLAALAQLVRR